MILKKFKDNYDAEFVNLMLKIQSLLDDFCKCDKLKINSWAKILCVPTMNIEFKKNRNLYAIKLLDNVFNGKLEEPFTKFVKDKELKLLDPIIVKTQLTNKFLNYIRYLEEEENIHNNPNMIDYNFLNNQNNLLNKIQKKKSLKNIIERENKAKNNKNNNKRNNFGIDYYNQFLLAPFRQKRSQSSYKISNKNYEENNNKKDNLNPSDILLMKNFDNFPYKKKSEIMELKCYNYNKYEKYKLKNIAEMLNLQRQENNDIILSNKNEIGKLKKRISLMSIKLKNIFDKQN